MPTALRSTACTTKSTLCRAFVHGRSRDQLRLPFMFLKGETPVIYFYTKEKQNVRVGVGFPRGIWTQWYPQAASGASQSRHAGRAIRRAAAAGGSAGLPK